MINLFEYRNQEKFKSSLYDDLEIFLDDVWSKREQSAFYNEDENREQVQRFLQFIHKSKELKSSKYVGVIHFEGETINLLPKIFFENKPASELEVKAINTHILWWLSYCRKLKFPNYLSGLSNEKADFFEILIYLFSKYTRELLNSTIYQKYVSIERETSFVKGRIDVPKYITENLSRARFHKVSCVYDSFEMDNEFNRCIKYVAKMLLAVTKDFQSKRFLNEIIFILDDVKDSRVSVEEMKRLSFNPMFSSLEAIRDYCVLFLDNSVSFNYKNDLKLFAFLLPMEYVFEDFVFGFIDKEIEDVRAKDQVKSKFLTKENKFQLRPDLRLDYNGRKIIADTKYKIVYSDDKDPKNGISQTDLYQMLAYAVRFDITEIILYYPNTLAQEQEQNCELTIEDSIANDTEITVRAWQIPIINKSMFSEGYKYRIKLRENFEELKNHLKDSIVNSINDIVKY